MVIFHCYISSPEGTKYDLRPDLCPERLVSVGHRHLLCVSFSVDVRTLAPVVSLLLGCWSGGSPSLMTVVSSQLVRSQGNEMNRKSAQHHCNIIATVLCRFVDLLCSWNLYIDVARLQPSVYVSELLKSVPVIKVIACMPLNATARSESVYTFFGYQYYW